MVTLQKAQKIVKISGLLKTLGIVYQHWAALKKYLISPAIRIFIEPQRRFSFSANPILHIIGGFCKTLGVLGNAHARGVGVQLNVGYIDQTLQKNLALLVGGRRAALVVNHGSVYAFYFGVLGYGDVPVLRKTQNVAGIELGFSIYLALKHNSVYKPDGFFYFYQAVNGVVF